VAVCGRLPPHVLLQTGHSVGVCQTSDAMAQLDPLLTVASGRYAEIYSTLLTEDATRAPPELVEVMTRAF
jgi:hypothetical protein